MAEVRELRPGDEEPLERFLVQHPDTTMFLRNNWREGGLAPGTERCQGTWAGAFEGEDVVAAGALFWNGNVMVEGEEHLEDVTRTAVRGAARPAQGVIGTPAQVSAVRACLGLEDRATYLDSVEDLFSLDLANLRVPEALASGVVMCRYTQEADVPTLIEWRTAYTIEALNLPEEHAMVEDIEERVRSRVGTGDHYVLEADGAIVAMTAWNAKVPDCYQVGGVYTPPPLRSRGYARSAVGGSLLDARSGGVARSILFTPQDNAAARACYLGLGYEIVGLYQIVGFEDE